MEIPREFQSRVQWRISVSGPRNSCIRWLLLVAASALVLPAPASAQGLFEALFGNNRRPSPPANLHAFTDPFTALFGGDERRAVESGPALAYCVRTCDGRYFPVQAQGNASAAETCKSFCPASKTKIYSGAKIDNATASDGTRYADLDNAFVYRDRVVDGCSCNGRDAFGLAAFDPKNDQTLRPGDIVATRTGLVAVSGKNGKAANFTPVSDYRGLSQNYRDKLSAVKIMPENPGLVNVTVTEPAREDPRRAQLAR